MRSEEEGGVRSEEEEREAGVRRREEEPTSSPCLAIFLAARAIQNFLGSREGGVR